MSLSKWEELRGLVCVVPLVCPAQLQIYFPLSFSLRFSLSLWRKRIRMVWVGRNLRIIPFQPLAMGRGSATSWSWGNYLFCMKINMWWMWDFNFFFPFLTLWLETTNCPLNLYKSHLQLFFPPEQRTVSSFRQKMWLSLAWVISDGSKLEAKAKLFIFLPQQKKNGISW